MSAAAAAVADQESGAVRSYGSPNFVPATVAGNGVPCGRFPVAFSRQFFLLLIVGLVWIGPAWSDSRFLYAMLAWDIAVLVLWAADLARVPKPQEIQARRIWSAPLQLAVGGKVTLELRNASQWWLNARITDEAPRVLRREKPEIKIVVPPLGTGSGTYFIHPQKRGDVLVGDVFVRCRGAWDIAERWVRVPLAQTVRTYPNLEQAQHATIYLIRSRQIALEKRHKHHPGQGREFESLRDYREGDEWRRICWSAVARRGKLISKTYQVERSQTVWLVLDTGRLLRAAALGLTKLDYSVSAALSLAQVAMFSGDRVAALTYGRRVKQRLAAGRGPAHIRTLLEMLAQTATEDVEADHLRATEALLTFQKRRSIVVWFTDLTETATIPDVIESASRLARRHVVLFTLIAQPELRDLLATRPGNDRQMYRHAAAQEIVQRRDALLQAMRQQGALTLEVEPGRLSSAVVNQYLMTKERGLI